MPPGATARVFFYLVNWIFAAVALALSAVVIHDSPVHEHHWRAAIVILVASAFAMVAYAIILPAYKFDRRAKMSYLYAETFTLLVIWTLFLGGAITLSTRWATGVGCNIKPPTALCREYRALTSFAWIHFAILFFLLGIVVGIGIVMNESSTADGGPEPRIPNPTMWERVESRRLEKERAAAPVATA